MKITSPELRRLAKEFGIPLDHELLVAVQAKIDGEETLAEVQPADSGSPHYEGPHHQGYPHEW